MNQDWIKSMAIFLLAVSVLVLSIAVFKLAACITGTDVAATSNSLASQDGSALPDDSSGGSTQGEEEQPNSIEGQPMSKEDLMEQLKASPKEALLLGIPDDWQDVFCVKTSLISQAVKPGESNVSYSMITRDYCESELLTLLEAKGLAMNDRGDGGYVGQKDAVSAFLIDISSQYDELYVSIAFNKASEDIDLAFIDDVYPAELIEYPEDLDIAKSRRETNYRSYENGATELRFSREWQIAESDVDRICNHLKNVIRTGYSEHSDENEFEFSGQVNETYELHVCAAKEEDDMRSIEVDLIYRP